ncbi:MAG: Phosphomethylpyrimidine synthase [Planctomycetes bacterium ADurb.Bin126]|nr:MAG: Phosphomethylpyrimidine synthase [Planctomycetes bacterium ADurb.Bin126]HOD81619.1 phosphomethylpyrimidine synthase ThiC [Phycisphaerae bacterium]HQL71941.1 phosphomethylpyrimidine synthase ThiC [Phycisphaerae bacterium]
MTQLEQARAGVITPQMERVAQRERLAGETVRDEVAAGRLVIPANRLHLAGPGGGESVLDPCGIGRCCTTKINANIGASPLSSCRDLELTKLQWAVRYGADAVMDLSTGGDLDATREHLIAHATVPIGTVPMYSMIVGRKVEDLTREDILAAIRHQAAQGVDFFTIHAGILRKHIDLACRRKMGIVSRGGSLLARWMVHHGRENPMYEMFDEITAILKEYDVAYSLGDGLRPGCLADASDDAQFAELDVLGELVDRSRAAGVQAMVEGPGHIPFDQIEMNMKRQQAVCDGAPFYVLGPVVSDVFPGYDHITSCIGATAAAFHGASFLCYVTPTEHLGLPTAEDVRAGCVAYKIAAHAADVARGLPAARDWDDAMADARAAFNWQRQFELAFDGEAARAIRSRDRDLAGDSDYCSMCGRDWCAVRISKELKQAARNQ